MRTPGHDDELTAGFLFSENILKQRTDLIEISIAPMLRLNHAGTSLMFSSARNAISNTVNSNGISSRHQAAHGRSAIEQIESQHPPLQEDDIKFPATILNKLPDHLRRAQNTFEQTGGVHAAALFNKSGNLIVSREDVGRHNAVDKVLGHAFLNNLAHQQYPMVSGRVSFEINQKALAGRIPLIAAISAPSSLAVQCANENNQTLVAFLRNNSMNIYAGAQRII